MDNSVFEKYKLDFDDDMKKAIIESAATIYGEEFRELFEERMANFALIQYITPKHLKDELNDKMNGKKHELTIKFLREKGFDITSEDEINEEMKKLLRTYFGWSEYSNSPYNSVYAFGTEEIDERNVKDRCRFLSKMGIAGVTMENYTKYASSPEGITTIEEIKNTLSIILSLDKEFSEYKGQFTEEERYLKECDVLTNKISNEATRKYYEAIKEYLTDDERRKVEQVFNKTSTDKSKYYFSGTIARFLGNDITAGAPIEAFSEAYDSYDKEMKMIQYFKACGLDLGYEYSAYENSKEAKKLIPPSELVEKIKATREKFGKEVQLEYFKCTGTIGDNLEQIQSFGLLDTVEFSRDFVESKIICIQNNAVRDASGQVKNFNLLFYPPLAADSKYKNVFFIHEVLHCLESSMREINGECVFSTGFEKMVMDISPKEDTVDIDKEVDNSSRKYALLSENIHQNLAIEVTEDLISRGIKLLGDDEKQKTRGGASYEKFNWVTYPFYTKFKKAIIEARVSGDTDKLKSRVGERNFEQLNDLVNEYESLPYFQMMSAVVNGQENDLTKRRNEIRTKADLIVDSMSRENREAKIEGVDR